MGVIHIGAILAYDETWLVKGHEKRDLRPGHALM